MLARLIAYSSVMLNDSLGSWIFDIELHTSDGVVLTENLSSRLVMLVGAADNGGSLYRLCRAILDKNGGDYQALVGIEFHAR